MLITKDFRWCSIDRFQYYNIFYALFFNMVHFNERCFMSDIFSLFLGFISVSITSVSCFYFLLPYLKKPEHECFVRSPRVLMYTCTDSRGIEVQNILFNFAFVCSHSVLITHFGNNQRNAIKTAMAMAFNINLY